MGQGMGLEVKWVWGDLRVKEMNCQCHFEVLVDGLAVVLGEIEVLIDGWVVSSEKLLRSSIH